MRVAAIVVEGVPAVLHHPIVGNVAWGEIGGPGSGYVLYFVEGPEANRPLTVDTTVLHDDRWELTQ